MADRDDRTGFSGWESLHRLFTSQMMKIGPHEFGNFTNTIQVHQTVQVHRKNLVKRGWVARGPAADSRSC